MTDKDFVLITMRECGMRRVQDLWETSESVIGTELYEKEDYIPDFFATVAKKNMLECKAGKTNGFLCRSSTGRIVRLIQNYNSDTYPQESEELPVQWGFYWSDDPEEAPPFVAISTSPYNIGDCCTRNDHVQRSGQNSNIWEPGTVSVKWTDLGTIGEVMGGWGLCSSNIRGRAMVKENYALDPQYPRLRLRKAALVKRW